MSTTSNIVSAILQYLGPAVVNKIASALGMEAAAANKAVGVAVPAILAGIIGRATGPGGAKGLEDALTRQEPGALDRLAEAVGSSRQGTVAEQGRSALGALIGVEQIGSLAGALSKFTGGSLGNANTLLGLVTPGILGVLGREQKAKGLDGAGLVNWLGGQKHNIASALPAEFKGYLNGTTLLDGITATTPRGSASTADSRPKSTSAPEGTTYIPRVPPTDTAGAFSWTGWLTAIAAASALWLSVFGERTAGIFDLHSVTETRSSVDARDLRIGSIDVGSAALDALEAVNAATASAKAEPASRAALLKLQDAASRLEKVESLAAQLRPDARRRLAESLQSRVGPLRGSLDALSSLANTPAPMKAVIEQMRTRIASIVRI